MHSLLASLSTVFKMEFLLKGYNVNILQADQNIKFPELKIALTIIKHIQINWA